MSQIKIHHPDEAEPCNKVGQLIQRIRERAYALFEKRDSQDGYALDDWLQAEHELLYEPGMTIEDRDKYLCLTAGMADFKPKEIHIDAQSDSILVTAEHRENSHADRVEQECVAQFDLPATIDPNRVTATLRGGRLEIVAAKSSQPAKMAAGQ
jgi:HSP20 family molecular chaperone IbpA